MYVLSYVTSVRLSSWINKGDYYYYYYYYIARYTLYVMYTEQRTWAGRKGPRDSDHCPLEQHKVHRSLIGTIIRGAFN